MNKDREKAFREESERAYRRWLKETGRKELKKKKKQKLHVSSKQIVPVVAVGLCVAFVVGLVFFWNSTASAPPENENTLPSWASFPENIPENMAENVPENIPAGENIVENIPENMAENVLEDMVLFRFISGFTYRGEGSLRGAEWDFPWPHIGEQIPVGIPDEKILPVEGWKRPGAWVTYPWELGNNNLSKLVWLRVGIDKDGSVEFENVFENGFWTSTGARYLDFRYLSEPIAGNENFMLKAMIKMVDWNLAPRDSLRPDETVSVQGIFLVKKENAGKVRIGDLATEGLEWLPEENRWIRPLKPEERKAPLIVFGMPGTGFAKNVTVLIQLERYENGAWATVEKFCEKFENIPFNYITFIDIAS